LQVVHYGQPFAFLVNKRTLENQEKPFCLSLRSALGGEAIPRVEKRLLQAFGRRNDPLGQIVRQRRICLRHDFGAKPLAMTIWSVFQGSHRCSWANPTVRILIIILLRIQAKNSLPLWFRLKGLNRGRLRPAEIHTPLLSPLFRGAVSNNL
jgi:hypothetical protein